MGDGDDGKTDGRWEGCDEDQCMKREGAGTGSVLCWMKMMSDVTDCKSDMTEYAPTPLFYTFFVQSYVVPSRLDI